MPEQLAPAAPHLTPEASAVASSSAPESPSTGLGVTLSGGGFRASLFHLGVIRFLRDAGLLKTVTHICSVSGGSVLAAHLLLRWDDYTSEDNTRFEKAANDLIRNLVQRDVRGRILREILCRGLFFPAWVLGGILLFYELRWRIAPEHWLSWWLGLSVYVGTGIVAAVIMMRRGGRTHLLERDYQAFYGEKPLRQLSAKQGCPDLYILATGLTDGKQRSFTRAGLNWIFRNEDTGAEEPLDTGGTPVATAVAASSAFPPFFPPVRLTYRMLRCRRDQFRDSYYMTDGGVYDNLGLEWIQKKLSNVCFRALIVSDAQGAFDWDARRFYFTLRRNVRASDILMKRVSDLEDERVKSSSKTLPVFRCQIGIEVPRQEGFYSSAIEMQRGLAKFRTDFDNFTDLEVHLLMAHGYAVARQKCKELVAGGLSSCCNGEPWTPIASEKGLDIAKAGKVSLESSQRLNYWRWLYRPELLTLLNLILLLISLFAGGILLWGFFVSKQKPPEITKVTTQRPDDPVILANDWLLPVIDKMDEQGEGLKKRHNISDFGTITIYAKYSASPTLASSNASMKLRLSCNKADYAFDYGYAFRLLSGDPGGVRCEFLFAKYDPDLEREQHALLLTVPSRPSWEPTVNLLFLVPLKKKSPGALPDNLNDLFELKEVQ